MRIPKYWAKGKLIKTGAENRKFDVVNWQSSDVSVDDARQKALARAGEVAQKILHGEPLDRYGYSDRPLREEIKEGIQTVFRTEVAVVTRNAYGALVLNSSNAMFIDIDIPGMDKPRNKGKVGGGQESFSPDPYLPSVRKVEEWAGRHPEYGIRIYATYAGLRCLILNTVFEPKSDQASNILQDLQSDPLYIRLCKAQECFRARLTPKPWRSGARQPRSRYPWENPRVESEYRQWEKQYDAITAKYSTCRLIKQIGAPDVHPDIEPVLSYHDRVTRVESNLPLA